ncbi:TPA: hypothetical protein MIM87_04095 [Klebsiella variicola]|nr:hypothetical protein CWM62_01430 [Klebsiella sp. C-Nf10]PJX55231.1 hypothetical protein CWM54_06895 [Klebsiella sp. D-Nf1]PXK68472.1 hypothetical protein DMS07_26305 [Klebsiella variicola]PXL09803.1 hypothetical protein DMS22_10095 [Klebsiella variicola]HBX9996292.1 hypothetical protein [Klebsiella variicola]
MQNGVLLFNARNSSHSAINVQENPVRIRVLPEYVQFEFSGISVQIGSDCVMLKKTISRIKQINCQYFVRRENEAVWTQGGSGGFATTIFHTENYSLA